MGTDKKNKQIKEKNQTRFKDYFLVAALKHNIDAVNIKAEMSYHLKEMCGLVVGVASLDGGVIVPSSCSLSKSTVERSSGVVAPLSWGVGWLLIDSI